jgi:DNA polymerase-3 subunit alpha
MTILNCKSHYTLLKSTNKPDDIVKRCNELDSEFAVLADQDSISGSVDFSSTLQKKGIKPIIGCEFSVIQDEKVYNQVLIARNQEGWQNLLELSSRSYDDDRYIDSPSLTWDIIKEHSRGLIGYTGKYLNYLQVTGDKAGAINHAESLRESLDELFVSTDLPSNRDIAKQLGLKCVNSNPGYYAKQDDARYQRLVLCTSMNATFNTVEKKMQLGEAIDNHQFFVSDKFFIDSFKDEELDNAKYINSICDLIQLESKPRLPQFDCPNGLSEKDYLQDLSKIGLERRGLTTEEYLKRLEYELSVVNSYDVLNTYFLIVQDFVVWAKNQGWLVGPGRGSCGGSLLAYLLRIIEDDPIKYGLIFERFYNAGRNTPTRISLPDIDMDFQTDKRKPIIEYISNKYGKDCVGHMATFGRLQGRSAIREVLRVNAACSADEMNIISKRIPNKFEIDDDMQDQGQESILMFTMENMPNLLHDWARLNDNGEIEGDYAEYFKQAVRLEGLNRNQGKHPSGIIIADKPIRQIAPLIRDKEGNRLVGYEMKAAEGAGLVKFDILGINLLNKLQGVSNLIRTGRMF